MRNVQWWLAAAIALAGCAGDGAKHARSASVMVNGPDCRSACLAQLQGNEFVRRLGQMLKIYMTRAADQQQRPERYARGPYILRRLNSHFSFLIPDS